jgi:hypothetical protein
MYWTDWGSVPKIERSWMNGQNREVVHSRIRQMMKVQQPRSHPADPLGSTAHMASTDDYGVAMDSLKYHLRPPCPTLLRPAGRPPGHP